MDLLVIAKKIYDDCTDTIDNISGLSSYYPDLSTVLQDAGRIVDSGVVENFRQMITAYPQGFTIMNGTNAVPVYISEHDGQIWIDNKPSDSWAVISTYDNFKYFVSKIIKGRFSNLIDFTDYFTYDYEIDQWTANVAEDIWIESEEFYEEALTESDSRNIYLALIEYFQGTLNPVNHVSSINTTTREITIYGDLYDLANHATNIDDIFENYNVCLETQNIMKLISEQVLQGHSSREELVSILTTCKNSYSNEGAEVIEQFLNVLQEDSPFAFVTSLYSTYMSMKKTSVVDGELSFYDANLTTKYAYQTVIKATLSALGSVVTIVGSAINPVVGAIIGAISTGFSWIDGSITSAESVSINHKAVNRCFGYPLVQQKANSDVTNYAYRTIAYNNKLITVVNPLMYYSAWTDNDKSNILYEAFPKVTYSKTTLQHIFSNMIGYATSMSGEGYEFQGLTTTQVRNIWKYLSEHEDVDAYQYMSDDDQRWVLNAVMILLILLGNDVTNNALHTHNEYNDLYPAVSQGHDLNYRLIHYPNNWNKMYEYYQYYATQCSGSIYLDSMISDENWYDLSDNIIIDSEGNQSNTLFMYPETFWDRNCIFATPPKYRKGSIVLTIFAITVAVVAIAVTALVIKRKIENKRRLQYARINAQQSSLQDGLKDGTITDAQATQLLNDIRKDTKRYNRVAKLTHSSTLSYYSGWETGDNNTNQSDNRSNALSSLNNNNKVYLAITGESL